MIRRAKHLTVYYIVCMSTRDPGQATATS